MSEQNWESTILPVVHVVFKFNYKDRFIRGLGIYSNTVLFIKTDTNYHIIMTESFEAQTSVLKVQYYCIVVAVILCAILTLKFLWFTPLIQL